MKQREDMGAQKKGLLILHCICGRDSEFKVGAVSKNKSHHKRLRCFGKLKGKEREEETDCRI